MIRTAELGQREWGACLMLGATPLLISVLLKCTPERWLQWRIFNAVDENKEMDNQLTKTFNSINDAKVGSNVDDEEGEVDPKDDKFVK